MKAFVTGGTGFIGSHLVDALIPNQQYSEVRCLVRNNEKWLKGKDYTRVRGDLHDLRALKKAAEGADVIFHAAGVVKAPDYRKLKQVNVEATENILRVAHKQGVKKVVILSSLAAAGPARDRPLSESDPMRPVSNYGRSKKEMEQMIHRVAAGFEEMSITILRPTAVYGPREQQILTFFKMANKRICPIIGNGRKPKIAMAYVGDVVQAMLKAARQEEAGVHTYFISGIRNYSWNEIRGTTTKVLGKKTVPLYIKPAFVKKIARVVEKAASFIGTYPVINRDKANELILEWTCTIDKARRELDYEPTYSLGEGISRTIHWYQMHHWL